jgi:hypothetical protein
MIKDGPVVGRTDQLYGISIGSMYQSQGVALDRQFKRL